MISARPNNKSYGNGFTPPPSMSTSSPKITGRNSPGNGDRTGHSRSQRPRVVGNLIAIEIASRHYYGFYGEIFETIGHFPWPEQVEANLGIKEHGIATPTQHRLATRPTRARNNLLMTSERLRKNSEYMSPNYSPFDSRCVGAVDNSAHGSTGDRHWTNSHFVQSFQGHNVSNSSCAATSEGYGYLWSANICYLISTSVHRVYFLLSRAIARKPISRRKNPSGHLMRSTAAYARSRAFAKSLPSAVTVKTRPPSARMTPSTSWVPP